MSPPKTLLITLQTIFRPAILPLHRSQSVIHPTIFPLTDHLSWFLKSFFIHSILTLLVLSSLNNPHISLRSIYGGPGMERSIYSSYDYGRRHLNSDRDMRCGNNSDALLTILKRKVEEYLGSLQATTGCDNVKVDVEIKSWKESDQWDLIEEEREQVITFRLDFKSVISYL